MSSSFSWPSRELALYYLRVVAVQVALFAVVYGGCNWLTAHRSHIGHYYLAWELQIPFMPNMIWLYHSILLLFLVPMLVFKRAQVTALGRAFASVTLLGGLCFLLFPGVAGFTRPDYSGESGLLALAFRLLYDADNVHNVMPSLHVAYCTLVTLSLLSCLRGPVRGLFWLWLLAIMTSTVLVHQHHLIDLPTGMLLGYFGFLLFRRWSGQIALTLDAASDMALGSGG